MVDQKKGKDHPHEWSGGDEGLNAFPCIIITDGNEQRECLRPSAQRAIEEATPQVTPVSRVEEP